MSSNEIQASSKSIYQAKLDDTLQCLYCTDKISRPDLDHHIACFHSHEPGFRCRECNEMFKTPKGRDTHQQSCPHYSAVCERCSNSYKLIDRKMHMMKHVRETCIGIGAGQDGKYQCSKCDRRFERHLYLMNHMLIHFLPNNDHECPRCASVFALKTQLNVHLFKCPAKRQKEKNKISKLRPAIHSSDGSMHMVNHGKVNKSQHSRCQKLIENHLKLERHRAECIKMTTICSLCDANIEFNRIQHLKAHAEEEIRVSGCSSTLQCPKCSPDCPRRFKSIDYLCNHLVLSHYETARAYDRCSCGFRTENETRFFKADYELSNKGVSIEVKEPPQQNPDIQYLKWRCPVCPGLFDTEGDCEEHIISIHGDDETEEILTWKCPVCLILFRTESGCEDHILQSHRGESVMKVEGGEKSEESECLDVCV